MTDNINVEKLLSMTKKETKQLQFAVGKADAEAGYPLRDSSPGYLDGYAVGSMTDDIEFV
jgi:hypothetical protein